MNHFGLNSEYNVLKSVLLHKPGMELHNHPCPACILQNAPIDAVLLQNEFDSIVSTYQKFGIEVQRIDSTPMDDNHDYQWNMMYCRDLLFMTPEGAILSNMYPAIRKGEVKYAERTLEKEGVPILKTIDGEGIFEGADALWINEKHVIVGVGGRTNMNAFEQLKKLLNKMNVVCEALPSCQTKTQHLLGTLQIVDEKLVFLRHEIADKALDEFLKSHDFSIIHIPENKEVQEKQAMNIVTIAPRKIIMTAGCPVTKKAFADSGIEVLAEIDIPELMKGAGGLACATGIIYRDWF
ncbi:MAG: arginine deiminase family protein [Bacteroidota bacterium]